MGKAAFTLLIASSFAMNYPVNFPEIAADHVAMMPLKWDSMSPDTWRTTYANVEARMINNYARDNHKAAAMILLEMTLSKEGNINDVWVEGNEGTYTAVYDPATAQEVDWAFADVVADELGISHPKRTTTLAAGVQRRIGMENSPAIAYPYGAQEVFSKIEEEFSELALGKKTVDEACESLQAFADKITS